MKRSAAATATAGGSTSVESNDSKQTSLMDQWKDHYNKRDFSTKPHHLHRMGLFTYVFCLLAVPLVCVVSVLPGMDLSLTQWLSVCALMLFLIVENLLNFIACVRRHHDKDVLFCFHCNRVNPLTVAPGNSTEPRDSSTGWRHCPHCQQAAPPRSHHCKICGECVLRRDHHCYFLCCCIGHYNQKHFLVLCVYSAAGLLLTSCLLTAGLTDQLQSPWRLILPVTVWQWLTGHCSFGCVGLSVSLYLQIGCLVVVCIYQLLETVLVLRGQTFYEMGRNLTRYDLGVFENLRACLGRSCLRWPLLMLYPFDAEQSADGVNWRVTKQQ